MFVAASTRCFPELPLTVCLDRLADLEYNAAEIVIGKGKNDLNIDEIMEEPLRLARKCMNNRQVKSTTLFMDLAPTEPEYFEKFVACCRLAKALRIVTISVLSAPWGTPYNEEIERLRRMTQYASLNGIVIGIMNQSGSTSDLPESINSLCQTVPDLAVTLDPSYYVFNREKAIDYDSLIPRVCHVRLRDTTAAKFQVQIGQGVLDYGKLITLLNKIKYSHALCVDLEPMKDINQESEMRKMRFLLESCL